MITRKIIVLLLVVVLAVISAHTVEALEDIPAPMQVMPNDPKANGAASKPKLLKPKTGIMKEDHDVDPGNQRARADEAILENAEEYQPEPAERVIESMDDLTSVVDKLFSGLQP